MTGGKAKGKGKKDSENDQSQPQPPDTGELTLQDIMKTLKDNHKELNQKMDNLTTKVENNKELIQKVKKRAAQNSLAIEANEQNSRLNSLRLNRAPPLKKGEDCDTHVCAIINKHLKNHLGFNLRPEDIDVSHPLGPPVNNTQYFIIKFIRRTIRNKVYKVKKYFSVSNSGIENPLKTFISEDLTKTRRTMMKLLQAIEEEGDIDHYWSLNGNLYVIIDEDKGDITRLKIIMDPEEEDIRAQLSV